MESKTESRKALQIALIAVLTALTTVFTIVVRVPTPIKGYISLCDVAIVFSAYLFGPWTALITGGLGTAIADVIGGYSQWAPFSFLIHGLQGALIGLIAKHASKTEVISDASVIAVAGAGLLGTLVMVGGYFIVGGFFYGFEPAATEIPLNLIQSVVGVILGITATKTVRKAYPPVRYLTW